MHEFNLRVAIAWLSCLTIVLLIRFAWKREPLERHPGTLLAALVCAALFLVFRFTQQPDDPAIMRSGFMWGILMIVGRSILLGGQRKQAAPD